MVKKPFKKTKFKKPKVDVKDFTYEESLSLNKLKLTSYPVRKDGEMWFVGEDPKRPKRFAVIILPVTKNGAVDGNPRTAKGGGDLATWNLAMYRLGELTHKLGELTCEQEDK